MMHALTLTTEELRMLYVSLANRPLVSDDVLQQIERHLEIARSSRQHYDNINESK